jgi:RNA-directed DNA polymerase
MMLRQPRRQQGRRPICTGLLLHAEQPHSPQEWEQWLSTVRKAITKKAIVRTGHGPSNELEQHLLHTDCWNRVRRRQQPPYISVRQ